jgi:hypothetical protein
MSFERLLNTFEKEESIYKALPYNPVKYTEEKWRYDKSGHNPEGADYR